MRPKSSIYINIYIYEHRNALTITVPLWGEPIGQHQTYVLLWLLRGTHSWPRSLPRKGPVMQALIIGFVLAGEQTIISPVIWYPMLLMWRYCNEMRVNRYQSCVRLLRHILYLSDRLFNQLGLVYILVSRGAALILPYIWFYSLRISF